MLRKVLPFNRVTIALLANVLLHFIFSEHESTVAWIILFGNGLYCQYLKACLESDIDVTIKQHNSWWSYTNCHNLFQIFWRSSVNLLLDMFVCLF